MSGTSGTEAEEPSRTKVYLAFAAIYIIWGSTYFFIREALDGFPPFMLGGIRFLVAALLMFGWCVATGVSIKPGVDLKNAAITGFLLCFVGNGAVVWVEQSIASSVVAIVIAVAPLSFIVMDRPQWKVNFRSWSTLLGVVAGFAGVLLLFSEKIALQLQATEVTAEFSAMFILLLGIIGWPAGSIYAKYHPASMPNMVNSGWQMLVGAFFFLLVSAGRGEWTNMAWSAVPTTAWLSLAYLIVFGSIIGFSAYVWLLQVRPATQVSTYAYVNPVVAVLLGVFVGSEVLGWREFAGLIIILGGVLLINLARYRNTLRS
ncbi:MAG: EamA family transporter [Flavobacteriales bacterium]|nr:EamA family transporter [Flavobacteriales bacterium]